jgi:hypothetical protein
LRARGDTIARAWAIDVAQIEVDRDDVDLPGVLAAGVEQVVDQLEQVAGRGPGAGQVIAAAGALVSVAPDRSCR